jgi:hypothetical protein
MKQLNTMVKEEYSKKLKLLAVSEGLSIQILINEAIKDLLIKRGILTNE